MSTNQILREATHAGSWYTDSQSQLNSHMDGWLDAVKPPVKCIGPKSEGEMVGEVPVPGARVIIAPYVICCRLGSLKWMLRLNVDV